MSLLLNVIVSLLCILISYELYNAVLGRLSQFPGPVLARFSNLWRLLDVWKGSHHETLRKLHRKHGSVVRIGPNLLSLSDARWTKIIYSSRGEFRKTEFYTPNDIKLADGNVVSTTFSVLDNETHAEMIKPIQKLYNLNNVLSYENQIDAVVETLTKTLDTFTNGKVVDLGLHMLFSAYDVMGNLTLGVPIGYLEKQFDFDEVLGTSDRVWDYFARVSQMPWLDRWLAKSNLQWISNRFPSFGQTMQRRCAELTTARISKSKGANSRDFLEDFIAIGGGREEPNVPLIISWLSANVS